MYDQLCDEQAPSFDEMAGNAFPPVLSQNDRDELNHWIDNHRRPMSDAELDAMYENEMMRRDREIELGAQADEAKQLESLEGERDELQAIVVRQETAQLLDAAEQRPLKPVRMVPSAAKGCVNFIDAAGRLIGSARKSKEARQQLRKLNATA